MISNILFAPNENGLKTATLDTLSADLKAKMNAVQNTFVPFSNKLNDRDAVFNTKGTRLVDVGKLFKGYMECMSAEKMSGELRQNSPDIFVKPFRTANLNRAIHLTNPAGDLRVLMRQLDI